MHLANLFFVVTREYVLPFYKVGKQDMMIIPSATETRDHWDWLSSTIRKHKIVDRDPLMDTGLSEKDYKDLVINTTKERMR